MATQQHGWHALVSMWIFTALISSFVGQVSTDLNEILHPIVTEVTNKGITIRVPCLFKKMCQGVSLKYKKRNDSTWKEEGLKSISHIKGLDSDAHYDVETIVKMNGTDMKGNIEINTCPENIPELKGIRAVKTGPGWLDVRWNPIKENCKSNIYYLVQYGLENDTFSSWKAYGVFEASDGTMIFRPTHPCSTWDAEFCLLLTDHVTAGKNHTVKVKPVRHDPSLKIEEKPTDLNEEKMSILKNVFADSKFTGPYILGQADAKTPCQEPTRQGKSSEIPLQNIEVTKRSNEAMLEKRKRLVVVPSWAIVLAVLLLVSALILIIVTWRRRNSKSKFCQRVSPKESFATSTPPAISQNTDGNTNCEVDRASSMYDDCMSSEHMGSSLIPTQATYENQGEFSEKIRGLQNPLKALQKEIAVASASKVANKVATSAAKDKEKGPTQLPVSDHYLPMEPLHIYDDAQGLKNFAGNIYENQSGAERESNMYMEPTSPIYEEAKVVLPREPSMPYNEVYAHSSENPWRSW